MRTRARLRLLAALVAAACSSDPTGGGELLVVAQIDVQPPGATIIAGATQQLSATPRTSSGITVPNRTVSWSSGDQGIATVSNSGLVTGVAVGSAIITARVDDITRDVTITVTPKPVASVSVEPPQATIQVGASQQLLATPRDVQGQALQDRPVTFASDNPGVASVSVTGLVSGVAPGTTTVRATSEGRTGTSAITVSPRPAAKLGFTTQPANGNAGQALTPFRVAVQDAQGGTIVDATSSVTLSLANNEGGATLGGTLTVNAVAGVAMFDNVTLDRSGTGYTLRASASPLAPAVSTPFNIAAGAAGRLVMVTQPSATATSGAPLAVQPVVRIADANGNPVSQAGIPVTVQVVGAGATLAGNLTIQTAANGTASFANLSLSGTAGNYSLRFIAAGLVEVSSNAIALAQGTATQLGLLTPPSSTAQSGVPFPQQPVIQLRDAGGNAVAQAGVQITAEVAAGGGTLSGVTTLLTNSGGQAAFSGLALTGAVGGGHALKFSATGLGEVITSPITLTAGPAPTQLSITTEPSTTAVNGIAFPQQPAIQLQDAGGNPVAQAGVQVTVTIQTGGPDLSGTLSALTNAAGLATFTDLRITGLVGNRTLIFASSGLVSVVSGTIAVTPGAPDALVIAT
ncbi:MAG TPA: Ig-like domain-containing protein, partial [Gemmatimonadales bacterium]|nr:Ig-like domain-containing protein [Gemmatimonadales bacterium]